MSSTEKPLGLAIIICDQVITDAESKKKTLVGIFNQVFASKYPAHHPSMAVFVSVTGGTGSYRVGLRLVSLDQPEDCPVIEVPGKIEFKNPNQVFDVHFQLNGVVFPRPGNYQFEFLIDGEMTLMRRLKVEPREKKDA